MSLMKKQTGADGDAKALRYQEKMEKMRQEKRGQPLTEGLTRQELAELEAKEKTPGELRKDVLITFLPLICGLLACLEYLCLPNNSQNNRPQTYTWFLLVLMGIYLLTLLIAYGKKRHGDNTAYQKLLYKAPLRSALFLFLLLYDVLTLKTGILTQPFIPCMNSILNIAWIDRAMLLKSALHTLELLFIGYGSGVLIGLITGVTCGYSRAWDYWISPILKFLGPIPISTWIPIIMVLTTNLFGGAIFIIALGVWVSVTMATATGIRNIDKRYFDAARLLGAKDRELVFRIAIPGAMPNILQGMTQGMSIACTAIMIAEMMGVEAGLGWYITWAKAWASYDKMFAALFVIFFIFSAVTWLLKKFKNYILRWQEGVVH